MEDIDDDRGLAPKIFFVAPDPSVVSDSFLETAFLLGYEAYVVADDFGILKERVELLIDTFDELILFFSIARKGPETDWVDYLGNLQNRYGARVRIGVLYDRISTESDSNTKRAFLIDAGISAGCIALHPSSRKNHQLLLDVLGANQAAGRRKRIRMRCHSPFGVNFVTDDGFLDAALIDLSVSHFSAVFVDRDPNWDLGTKIKKVQLRLGGHLLMVKVLVGLKRAAHGQVIYVFLFHPETERPGLDDLIRAKVNAIIYHHFRSRTEALLEERFRARV